jgi:carboxymethylenebutenolidase
LPGEGAKSHGLVRGELFLGLDHASAPALDHGVEAPIDYTKDLSCPIIGLFGNEDKSPTPEQVNAHEAELKKHGKQYEFHRYDGAGHGFFYYARPAYRQEQAMDGWKKVFAFCERTLR